jgi:hypothetical protein
MLQVVVHCHNELTPSVANASEYGIVLAIISHHIDHLVAGASRGQRHEVPPRVVTAPVVDQNDFVGAVDAVEDAIDSLDQNGEGAGAVEHWDND